MVKKKMSFYQDNSSVHPSVIAMTNVNRLKYEMFPEVPQISPSRIIIFSELEKWVGSKWFSNKKEGESAVDGYFGDLGDFHYKQDIEVIEHHWEKCDELTGDWMLRNKCNFFKQFVFSLLGRVLLGLLSYEIR